MRYVLALAAALGSASSAARADYTAVVDPTIQYQRFEGWGTSLAWWAKVVGGFPAPIRADYMEKAFDPVRGLGLTVARYNIGGGENPAYLAPNRQFLQFRAAVSGYEPAPGKWDWSADANQRWVLHDAISRGVTQVEAFSNSPPYWMTKSGSVTGNHDGADNIKPDSYHPFADYLTAVTKHFRDVWGITFRSLEPFNEPSGGWWSFGGGQEGCHVDRPHQDTIMKAVGAALARREGASLAASDENNLGDAVRTFGYYDPTALKYLRKVNTHSYGGTDRTRLWDFASSAGKDLWMSEYGDDDVSGLTMSRRILEDMNNLHPTAWVYWQVVDYANWGLLNNRLRDETDTSYTINEKYYVLANYSRFIRPGYRFIAINDKDSLAAYDTRSHTLVIVTTNSGAGDERIHYDLSGFSRTAGVAQAYRTSVSQKLQKLSPITLHQKQFTGMDPARSVTTYVISGAIDPGRRGFNPGSSYELINRESGLRLEESGSGLTDFTPVAEGPAFPASASQQWRIVGLGGGVYKMVNRNDGFLLEVGGASAQDGAAVDLFHDKYDPPGASNQQWRIISVGAGEYEIVNTLSGLVLRASGKGGGAALDQAAYNGGATEKWLIRRASSTNATGWQ